MITVSRIGTTDENNRWVLPEGVTTMDADANEVRVHDGQTPGGYRVAMTRAYEPQNGPGPVVLKAGSETAGFYGEVTASELISGQDLITTVGLTTGTPINSETSWLKFSLDDKVLFVAMKPVMQSVSWSQLDALDLVFGKTVTINDQTYRLRLLKGMATDPASLSNPGYDVPASHGSEWNRLLYHVFDGAFESNSESMGSENLITGDWAQYSREDLNFGGMRDGTLTICQETRAQNTDHFFGRGYRGVSEVTWASKTTDQYANSSVRGWRPVLELVQ